MKPFFAPNLTTAGRLMRAAIAIAFLIAAILATSLPVVVRVLFAISAAFVGFEALRGWCVLRACGIKTRL